MDLVKSLFYYTVFHIFFIFSLLSFVGTSIKYLFQSIFSKYTSTLLNKRYKECTKWVFSYFESLIHVSNIVNKNIFIWIFIYFNIICIKIFHIDHIFRSYHIIRSYHITPFFIYLFNLLFVNLNDNKCFCFAQYFIR